MDSLKLIFTVFCLLSQITFTEETYCTKYTVTANPNDPPLPSLPHQYQTKIEANIVDKGKTVTGYEYFDNPGNRAMLAMLDTGVLHKLIFDYGHDELFYVTGDSCEITSLLYDDNNLLFGNNFTRKGIPHVFTSGGALHFAASFGERYMGNTTVRGIAVDHWQSCLYWAPMLSNFTLDYYFTVKNWSDPINRPQIPVRAMARGVQVQNDGTLRNFTHYYDYIDFLTVIKDYTVFETPEGILCSGRNKSRVLPKIPQNYLHYRAEIIDVIAEKVTYAEVWYDGKRNYTRKDYQQPGDSHRPLTEIHDFNFGKKYVIDNVQGSCLTLPLNKTDSDTDEVRYPNGTTILKIATMKELLFLDDSYAYTGQRLARGILCDVYSGYKTNFLKKSGLNATAVIDFFFLADGFKEYGDNQADMRPNVPVQAIATIDALGYKVRYHYMDVGELQPRYSVFDISPCLKESDFIEFTVRLQGDPEKDLLDQLKWNAQIGFAETMGVSHIRVQEVNLDYDQSFVYISAKLLPPFTPQPGIVNGPITVEPASGVAFNKLATAVYNGSFICTVFQPYFSAGIKYTAVDISINYGKLKDQSTPVLSGQFSYGLENSVPNVGFVFNSHIWYDYQYQLVRYDSVTGHPTTTIHDYNSGLAYTIDKSNLKCNVYRIDNSSFDVVAPTKQQVNKTGYVLKLRNPLQLFDLTNNFVYVGQKTIRGILCDVYENVGNFSFGGVAKLAVYQFYFMSMGWNELSIGSGASVRSQPVSLLVTAADSGETEHFDFYDFSEEHPDLSSFNIQPCFTGNQRRLFLIRFNQSYHPYLDHHEADFKKAVQRKLSILTAASPLRFQNAQLSNNGNYTFYVATMVQQAPDILDFTKTSNKQGVHSSDATYVGVKSDDDCAGYCRNITAFACRSFDFCSYKGLCQLSKLQTPDGKKLQQSEQCDHYSRTVNNWNKPEPSNKQAMVILQDIIDRTGFTVSFNISQFASIVYPAIMLAPNLINFDNNKAGSDTLSHFKVKRQSAVDNNDLLQEGLFSIDDCAKKCLSTRSFTCDSFTYCELAGECVLSNVHPDITPSSVTYSFSCDLYTRRYTDKYVKYEGKITQVQPDVTQHAVSSADVCAKNCYTNNQIDCKSFEYCSNTQTCYLKTSHILEASSSVNTSSDCSHYSKKYLYDFVMTPNKVVSDGKTVKHILFYDLNSDENCARLCIQNFGYLCKAFSYCGNVTQCIIYSTESSLVPTQTSSNNLCHLYTRQYFDDSSRPGNAATSQALSTGSTGYSAGAMAGIAIGMLLLGMLLGVALLYLFRTRQLIERKQIHEMETVDTGHDNSTSAS